MIFKVHAVGEQNYITGFLRSVLKFVHGIKFSCFPGNVDDSGEIFQILVLYL